LSDDFWALLLFQGLSGLSWSGFTLSVGNMLYELVPQSRRAAYVAFHNVGTAAGVFAGAMLGAALVTVLPPRAVLFGESDTLSNLLYLFIISGVARALLAALLARRVRELRRPRKTLSAHALVLRVTGFNAMLGVIYDFIGRPQNEAEERDEPEADERRAAGTKSGDNRP
jgi:MFS family permease